MKVKEAMEYDHRWSKAVDLAIYIQVMMVKGYFSNWKQIVYFDFDKPMIFRYILQELEVAGIVPIAAVSYFGASKIELRKYLSVTPDCVFRRYATYAQAVQSPLHTRRIQVFRHIAELECREDP